MEMPVSTFIVLPQKDMGYVTPDVGTGTNEGKSTDPIMSSIFGFIAFTKNTISGICGVTRNIRSIYLL